MTDSTTPKPAPADAAAPSALDDPTHVLVGANNGVALNSHSHLDTLLQSPLPGIVIFVHGVNSDGEWYAETEKGLCKGLNERLKRGNEHMQYASAAGGQLTPAMYLDELTPDGFINPQMDAASFIIGCDSFSPVIHFRWGYKADGAELKSFGGNIYLNEENYWGGGPFANGCTTLPDLWGAGLSDNLFLWMHVQHMNPTGRNVYSCPPRPYYVLAALRLAKLVESIRQKQADVPITIVCHSQGNMIGLAAAFLGDALEPVHDATVAPGAPGATGRCVADSYVLSNAPYSLVESNFMEDWTQGGMTDKDGATGRQTEEARIKTLAAFFEIVHQQAKVQMSAARIDTFMKNEKHGFTAQADLKSYGINGTTYGRVTLYCNPHDQVVSSTTVQGIGWRGMSKQEIAATGGNALFSQRVFARDFQVGVKGVYHYWTNHYRKPAPGSQAFWFPESPKAMYSAGKGAESTKAIGKILTWAAAPLAIFLTKSVGTRINALPEKDWTIPLTAPDVPPFVPEALRFGVSSKEFDQGCDAPGDSRDQDRIREADDPYANDTPIPKGGSEGARKGSDGAEGNKDSEASLRYDDHARLRMQARREGLAEEGAKVTQEDNPGQAGAGYKAWRSEKIKSDLAASINENATDHSTIMTNGLHAQRALAYDVAIGNCHIREEDLHELRIAADWRFLDGLGDGHAHAVFLSYFRLGSYKGKPLHVWAMEQGDGSMPKKIVDKREHPAPTPRGENV